MELGFIALILLSLYPGLAWLDAASFEFTLNAPLLAGAFAGLLTGNLTLGVMVGGTLQLMALGLITYGGTSVPDFITGAIIGTVFAAQAYASAAGSMSMEAALGVGLAISIPVGMVLIQLDIARRAFNTIWFRMGVRFAEEGRYNRLTPMLYAGAASTFLSRVIPCFLVLAFGEPLVNLVLENMPYWLMNGINTAGGMLPAMGMAILMRYLPLRKHFYFLIIGFTIFAFRAVPYNVIAIALIGFCLAGIYIMVKKAQEFRILKGVDFYRSSHTA